MCPKVSEDASKIRMLFMANDQGLPPNPPFNDLHINVAARE
jgi:hypothetical protein